MKLTCDGFDYTVRNLRDLLVYRNTEHLNGDPVQSSVTQHNNNFRFLSHVVSLYATVFPCAQWECKKVNDYENSTFKYYYNFCLLT